MKQQIRSTLLSSVCCLFVLGIVSVYPAGVSEVRAEVDVNINIGSPLPPAIVVEAPPTMIYLGTPGVYVAVGIPYDIFFLSGRYYYFHGDNWFWAAGYAGPWIHAKVKSLPPGLQKFKIKKLREFRAVNFKLYKSKGPKFKGKVFHAVKGPGSVKKKMKGPPGGPFKKGK